MRAFVPLECNPEVFTSLLTSMGVSKSLAFHDVFTIDDASLLEFIPGPCYALLLVFPTSDNYETYRKESDANIYPYCASGAQEPLEGGVTWYRQTIKNACGTYALLHAIANAVPRDLIKPNSLAEKLLSDTKPLDPVARATYLECSKELESAHAAVASRGETGAPAAEDGIDFHYVCLAKTQTNPPHLFELDGRRAGPIDLGELSQIGDKDDALGPLSLARVREFLTREGDSGMFSIIALSPSLD
ncbi:cysteine proteinase [Nadsonia fulvescens var. elongata DSM 6958]|uniref:Ubiquitin carboxyl-terminal hydrolase n=1 Tax=Nadsonia fulvescens var. elongata DSM 6958 TaxID=857566 RepID=A0A1E3PE81_9ASCO|nr:cysteine proteinase [Nadsonia fulvescens var. elongata DSM 6958]